MGQLRTANKRHKRAVRAQVAKVVKAATETEVSTATEAS